MLKKLLWPATVALAVPFMAQDALAQAPADTVEKQQLFKLDVQARVDWQLNQNDGHTIDSNTGFKARYLVFQLDGRIIPGLTYSWRQRMNKAHSDQSFFDATDWIYLNYSIDRWNFQAGKEVVAIGGWEYDRAPINLFGCSVFWNNIPCYQLGVSAGYDITSKDRMTFQAVQSPFFTPANRNMYSYNLMWNGSHGFYDAIWSANLVEYAKGRYINYLALGNKFTYDRVQLELDLMNRASSHQTFFFKDCSVMTELGWSPNARWRVHGKYTYDVNRTRTGADLTVLPGTELNMAGGGLEFYPLLKNKTWLRLHAACYYSWGKNSNADDVMQNKSLLFCAGITWDMNIVNIKK